jgi:hypothetical protein
MHLIFIMSDTDITDPAFFFPPAQGFQMCLPVNQVMDLQEVHTISFHQRHGIFHLFDAFGFPCCPHFGCVKKIISGLHVDVISPITFSDLPYIGELSIMVPPDCCMADNTFSSSGYKDCSPTSNVCQVPKPITGKFFTGGWDDAFYHKKMIQPKASAQIFNDDFMLRKNNKRFLAISVMMMAVFSLAHAQQKETVIKKHMEAKSYVFIAQSVSPMRGSMRQLTPEYDLRISPDSIIAWLPYFGRAYSAPLNSSEGGIKFTSTNFNYTVVNRNKGGWDIKIKTKDVTDINQLFLTVFANGSASLQVISNNRDPISFSGYISGKNKK